MRGKSDGAAPRLPALAAVRCHFGHGDVASFLESTTTAVTRPALETLYKTPGAMPLVRLQSSVGCAITVPVAVGEKTLFQSLAELAFSPKTYSTPSDATA